MWRAFRNTLLLVLLAVILFKFTKGNSKMKTPLLSERCSEMFQTFINKDFVNWKPWNNECVNCCLHDYFSSREGDSVVGFAGDKNLQARFSYYQAENYSGPIRIWYRYDHFLRLDASYPDINLSFPDGLAGLNGPDAKLDYEFGGMTISKGEWVFSELGITAYLNADYNRVIGICVFLPTTLKSYRDEIRSSLRTREF